MAMQLSVSKRLNFGGEASNQVFEFSMQTPEDIEIEVLQRNWSSSSNKFIKERFGLL
jgi:hypothetical protein